MLSNQAPGTAPTPGTPRTPRSRMELLPLVSDKLDDKVWLMLMADDLLICLIYIKYIIYYSLILTHADSEEFVLVWRG